MGLQGTINVDSLFVTFEPTDAENGNMISGKKTYQKFGATITIDRKLSSIPPYYISQSCSSTNSRLGLASRVIINKITLKERSKDTHIYILPTWSSCHNVQRFP